ncbi:hypothetical protein KKA23_01330 [Patescibacteria group bacterium]|nr:hypothetical protein [Patescibacteria group bacterium]
MKRKQKNPEESVFAIFSVLSLMILLLLSTPFVMIFFPSQKKKTTKLVPPFQKSG